MKKFVKYIVEAKNNKKESKHSFYRVSDEQIMLSEKKLNYKLPLELKKFYKTVGYGFFFNSEKNQLNRVLAPLQVAQINLREDFYEYDPDLEIYDEDDKLIFMEINESVYLTISKDEKQGKNAIYYFDEKIADSLEEFFNEFDKNPKLLNKFEL